eukprot:TRINITY_DN50023_c0_g1_i1.p1 TRINITY_DN50023_c0_g1~~TRINITY_DN50023_c0_g1_i1.p1  ORF type:complete len:287 (-),score=76.07 TRINITY_DN50023_c0_g1_i1:54-848(-)
MAERPSVKMKLVMHLLITGVAFSSLVVMARRPEAEDGELTSDYSAQTGNQEDDEVIDEEDISPDTDEDDADSFALVRAQPFGGRCLKAAERLEDQFGFLDRGLSKAQHWKVAEKMREFTKVTMGKESSPSLVTLIVERLAEVAKERRSFGAPDLCLLTLRHNAEEIEAEVEATVLDDGGGGARDGDFHDGWVDVPIVVGDGREAVAERVADIGDGDASAVASALPVVPEKGGRASVPAEAIVDDSGSGRGHDNTRGRVHTGEEL